MIHDLRYAFRLLARSPGFTTVAVLSLALGIGANTAIFSLVNVVLLRPIPVQDASRVASVFMTDQRNPGNLPLSHLNYKDLRDRNEVFDGLAAFTFAQVNWSTSNESEQVLLQVVSGNYFNVLGTQPANGRAFLPDEDVRATPVIVLSQGFWERSLGSDASIVGRTLTLNRTPFTVIGIAPQGFTGTILGANPAGWVPMAMHDVVQPNFDWYEQRRGLFLFAFGRLKPGVSLDQASANLKTLFAQLEQAFPVDNKGRSAGAVSLLDARLNPGGQGGAIVVQISMVLMTVVGIVLLIACANVANLLLARATRRRKEIAVRLALGAKQGTLVRQLLTESVVLAVAGAVVGTLLAYWLLETLISAELQLPIPVGEEVSIDGRVLAFTGILTVLTGLLFGLVPALQASRPDVLPVLKNEIVPAGGPHRGWRAVFSLRHALVVSQVALSALSLAAAGLFLRSLTEQQGIDTGFETRGVLVMNVNLGREGYNPQRGQLFYQQAADRARELPGVRAAAVAQNAPLAGGFSRSVFPEGEDTTTRDRILVQVNSVGEGYFDAIGVAILRGRPIERTDRDGMPRVVVINETMAQQFWPGQDALGKRFKFFGDNDFTTVVGVARNSKYNGVAEDPIPFIYQPLAQNYSPNATLHVRGEGNAAGLAPAVRRMVLEIDPTLSVFNIRTLEEQVSESLAPLRVNVVMLGSFGLLALALASIGLYGVASYAVTQRTREIGVRMALGAEPSSVLRLVLGRGLVLVAAGIAVGMAAALAVSFAIPPDLLPNVSVRDPVTLVGTCALLTVVALAANYLPARRATRIDPLIALRTE
jgi:macrolide transport system ATP-binding/permease protein